MIYRFCLPPRSKLDRRLFRSLSCSRRCLPGLLLLLGLFSFASPAGAQSSAETLPAHIWSAPRSWSLFAEYSPNSSHILLGVVDQRLFLTIGVAYSQRLAAHRAWQLDYAPEIRPLMIESDPVETGFHYDVCALIAAGQPCTPYVGTYNYPHKMPVRNTNIQSTSYDGVLFGQNYYQSYTFAYGRRWTYVGAFSPLGFRASFLPRSRVQPILSATAGFAVATRDIPMFETSAFNFTFTFGAGLQFWRTPIHATQLEYRVQHLSNADIGYNDPGVDSQMIHVSYVWGRRR